MENPMVNYAKIIAETNSKMYNVRDEYKNNSVEENIAICNKEHLKGAENFYIFGRKKFDKRSTVGAEKYINIVQYTFDDPIHADAEINERLEYMLKWNTVVLCEQGGDEIGSRKMALKYSEEIINPLFVFGSESHGIPPLITTNEHFYKVSIPQRGVLRSFNVSAAMNIICWDYIKEMHL